jgi:hypothetical protein
MRLTDSVGSSEGMTLGFIDVLGTMDCEGFVLGCCDGFIEGSAEG